MGPQRPAGFAVGRSRDREPVQAARNAVERKAEV